MKADASDGGEGGNFTFTTHDSPAKVLSFYQDKTKDLGMKVNLTTTGDDGGMIVAADEVHRAVPDHHYGGRFERDDGKCDVRAEEVGR